MYGPPQRDFRPPGGWGSPGGFLRGYGPLLHVGLFIVALLLAYLLLPLIKLFLTLIILLIAAYIIYRLLLHLVLYLFGSRGRWW